MAKRLSENEKIVLIKCFTEGKTVDELAKEFGCTKSTITRNIKRNIGQEKYKEVINKNKKLNETIEVTTKKDSSENQKKLNENNYDRLPNLEEFPVEESFPLSTFTELAPIDYQIDNSYQKDLASVPISEVDFPQIVYMIVDKKIELEIKYLKEYPEWQFLSQEELNRKTIEIYFDQKVAKRFCNKEQKVIKVPNTDVFKIVAPILLNKGISRIVSSDKLISL